MNPGEIGAYKTGECTYAIYDTETNDAEIITVDNTITANTKESQQMFKDIEFEFNQQRGHKLK